MKRQEMNSLRAEISARMSAWELQMEEQQRLMDEEIAHFDEVNEAL